ncbi:MAG: sugar phosphate nucleotidyltransferase [Acidobacteriota bacterium]
MNNVIFEPIILAGGSGTRLWPLSTPRLPKPFVPLGGLGTLYEATTTRAKVLGMASFSVVASSSLRAFCDTPGARFIEEPGPRNTAAAVALGACRAVSARGDDAVAVVLPSDHWIADSDAFAETVRELAGVCLEEEALGVMGIAPTAPLTGYGYIQSGERAAGGFRVARFTEKPDRDTASRMLAAGRYTWNSGMFVFPLKVLRQEMDQHCPGLWNAASTWLEAGDPDPYLALRSTSIDYALMEKSSRVVMVEARFDWSDVGNFASLHALLPKDKNGVAGWGPGFAKDCRNSLVITHRTETLVQGAEDLVIVETEDGLLASPMDRCEDIRSGVETILKDSSAKQEKP